MWDAPWHWVVLALVVIALFGYKKLPDAARSLGRSLRIFRTEIKGMSEDDAARAAKTPAELPATPPAAEPPAQPGSDPSAPAVPASADTPVDATKGDAPAS
jgi:sec-independent protein translocase protein TatA